MTDTAPIVFLDTETDGVHPGRRVWEIAMIRRDGTGDRTVSCFVEIDLSTADPFGLRVGRFYDRHPLGLAISTPDVAFDVPERADHVSPGAAARIVARMTHGAHLVGAVPNFDAETLAPLLREHGLTPAWHYHLIDIEALAVGYLAGRGTPVEPPWKSDELSAAIGVDPPSDDERHTALGDARWAMRVYDAVTGGTP